jgi:AbrB family looped-hinge helix DNA binding protein
VQRQFRIFLLNLQTLPRQLTAKYIEKGEYSEMKATGIVRRIDDLGRIVIPKEIRRTLRIRMGAPSLITLTQDMVFCMSVESAAERYIGK